MAFAMCTDPRVFGGGTLGNLCLSEPAMAVWRSGNLNWVVSQQLIALDERETIVVK